MKKKSIVVPFLLFAILLLGVSVWILIRSVNADTWKGNWTQTVTVENGVATPEKIEQNFDVNMSGKYDITLSWLPAGKNNQEVLEILSKNLGFITAVVIFDGRGVEIYARASESVVKETMTMELEKGTYHAQYYYLTDIEQYKDFAGKYLCGAYEVDAWADGMRSSFESLQKNGTWDMTYKMELSGFGSYTAGYATGAILGILIGACLIVLFLVLITKNHALESPKYDERQELERGRGFRYAFFTMLIYYCLLFIFLSAGLTLYVDFNLLFSLGLFLGTFVHVAYCIWHEAYFALNQKASTVMILFLLVGLANLLVTITHFISGDLIQDGRFTPVILNALCALMFFSVFVIMYLKKRSNDRINEEIEAADEEEE